jgi:hypothetical protein
VFPSSVATFYAPSDLCGAGGTRTERICAVNSWRGGRSRCNCVFINNDLTPLDSSNLRELDVARVRLFFSFTHDGVLYPCALINQLLFIGDQPDEVTGMWIVERPCHPSLLVVPLNAIYRAAHLIPVYRDKERLSKEVSSDNSLDKFQFYYVNKYIDHHAFELAHL